jgi:hypothetical protein
MLVLRSEIQLLEDLLEEDPDSKCKFKSHHELTVL